MWYYNDKVFDCVLEEFDSFVYLIERLNINEDSDSPIYYVGKKTFYNKSKYKGKRIIVESDWWNYYGSSDWLNEHVEKYGKHNFKRSILYLCRTKGDAGYLEAYEHMRRNVLHVREDGYRLYYNKNVFGRYLKQPEIYKIQGDIQNYINYNDAHGNKVWVTNTIQNRLVTKNIARDLVENAHWQYGRAEKDIVEHDVPKSSSLFNDSKIMIAIHKGNKQKWIDQKELIDWQEDGWNEGPLITKRSGTLHERNSIEDGIFVRDMRTDEKVFVSKDEYKKNKYLTSLKTRKVKIKRNNRIIFKGYLDMYVLENKIFSKAHLNKALKDNTIELIHPSGDKYSINYV